MFLMDFDMYECDYCGRQFKWDEHHEEYRGDIWECESCGKHFCTECFCGKLGREVFDRMLRDTDFIICPECYENNAFCVKEDTE